MWPTSLRFLGFAFLFVVTVFSSLGVSAVASTTVTKPLPDIPVRLIKQEYKGNETTIITMDLGRSDIRHSSLTLTTSGQDFRREVQIEGSADGQTWVKFGGQRFIFNQPKSKTKEAAKNTSIDYPATTSRYLRVTIYDRGEKPLIISGALAHRAVALAVIAATSTSQSGSSTTTLHIHFFENPLYLLIGLFILVVGVVGGLAFRLFKQTRV